MSREFPRFRNWEAGEFAGTDDLFRGSLKREANPYRLSLALYEFALIFKRFLPP